MTLSRLLRADAVLLGMAPKDKWDAIRRLVERLAEVGAIASDARDAVHEALLTRERSMSTGMERGVAIPHAAVDAIERPIAALALLPRGIGFESIDGRPATIVALLVIPPAAARQFARTPEQMAGLAALVGALAVLGGIGASLVWDTPAGPSIVVAATALFVLSLAGGLAHRVTTPER